MGLISVVVTVIIVVCIVGLLLWLANSLIPMPDEMKRMLNVGVTALVGLALLLWILQVFGLVGSPGGMHIPKLGE